MKYLGNQDKLVLIISRVPAMYVAISSLLALHAAKKTTGLVLELGDGVTVAVPIINGQAIIHAIQRFDFGGADLTDFLYKILMKKGPFCHSRAEKLIANDTKEVPSAFPSINQ